MAAQCPVQERPKLGAVAIASVWCAQSVLGFAATAAQSWVIFFFFNTGGSRSSVRRSCSHAWTGRSGTGARTHPAPRYPIEGAQPRCCLGLSTGMLSMPLPCGSTTVRFKKAVPPASAEFNPPGHAKRERMCCSQTQPSWTYAANAGLRRPRSTVPSPRSQACPGTGRERHLGRAAGTPPASDRAGRPWDVTHHINGTCRNKPARWSADSLGFSRCKGNVSHS